jgi:two-component system phosphate regulon response regulator PhoB
VNQIARILIVDNQADKRKRWKAALESADFRVVEAENSIDALALIRDTALGIDVLVTTVMSDLTGAHLAVEAVELRRDLPVIIVAWAGNPLGIQNNTIAVLLEPISDAELVATARALLSERGGHPE